MEHRVGWLDGVFVDLSAVGVYGALWLGLALAVAIAWRRPSPFLLAAAAVWTSDLSARALKVAIDRSRPPAHLAGTEALVSVPSDPSFPSGHAATSFAAALTLSAFVPRAAPVLFALAAAIAFSRLYVGVHYPLDVLGGAALGLCVAGVLLFLEGRVRGRRVAPRLQLFGGSRQPGHDHRDGRDEGHPQADCAVARAGERVRDGDNPDHDEDRSERS